VTVGPASFAYDADGNLTSDGSTTFAYDVENRLVSASGHLDLPCFGVAMGVKWVW
jgi:hypothetical protein